MKIAVIGAAGMVGSQLWNEARERGHEVTAYTRSGSAEGTEALDFFDTDAVRDVINNSDVTLISFAGRGGYEELIQAHRDLIAARPSGRFIVVGGAGALKSADGLLLEDPQFPAEYLEEARTFAQVLDDYRASEGLNWTVVAPSPGIAPGNRTGEYKLQLDVPAGDFVSTQDFAVAAIDEAEKGAHVGKRFTVASLDEAAAFVG